MVGLKRYPAFRWGNNADREAHTDALIRADTSLRITLTIKGSAWGLTPTSTAQATA